MIKLLRTLPRTQSQKNDSLAITRVERPLYAANYEAKKDTYLWIQTRAEMELHLLRKPF